MTSSDDLAAKLRDIALRWASEGQGRLAILRTMLVDLTAQGAAYDTEKCRAAERLAHALAGSAGTVGFPSISDALIPLEERLVDMLNQARLDPADRDFLNAAASRIPALIETLKAFV